MYTSVWDGQILTHATTREGISILVDANNLRDIQKDLAGGVYGCKVRLGPILATGSRLGQALGRLVCQDGHRSYRTLHRILSARKGSSWRRSYFILSPIMEQRMNLGGTGTSLSSCKPISGSLRVYYGGCGSLGILGRLYLAVTSILARISVPSALTLRLRVLQSKQPANTMSQIPPTSTSESPTNFETILTAALEAYNEQMKKDLASHPLATQLQSCDSPSAILAVLRTQVQTFDQSQCAGEKWTRWLNPTVNVLYAFSVALSNGVGPVSCGMYRYSLSIV